MSRPTNTELLDAYMAALLAISNNQSYTIDGRTLTRANLNDIKSTISWLEQRIAIEQNPNDALGIVQVLTN